MDCDARTLPDSFSKTIPIWAACINRAVAKLRAQQGAAPVAVTASHPDAVNATWPSAATGSDATAVPCDGVGKKEDGAGANVGGHADRSRVLLSSWDIELHTPPRVVSDSERSQIEALLDGMSDSILQSNADMTAALRLVKPLRPLWITPQTLFLDEGACTACGVPMCRCTSISLSPPPPPPSLAISAGGRGGGTLQILLRRASTEVHFYLYIPLWNDVRPKARCQTCLRCHSPPSSA